MQIWKGCTGKSHGCALHTLDSRLRSANGSLEALPLARSVLEPLVLLIAGFDPAFATALQVEGVSQEEHVPSRVSYGELTVGRATNRFSHERLLYSY